MPFRDIIKDYRRAAEHRFADALELMETPTRNSHRSDANQRHLRGAMYLAGYSIECFLKAYLIHQTGAQTLAEAMERLDERRSRRNLQPVMNIARTAAGHRIAYLVQLTNLETTFPGYDRKLWGRVGAWKSSWRYETDAVKPDTVQDFMEDVEAVVKWLQPKIGS
jgi:hypothetical protein